MAESPVAAAPAPAAAADSIVDADDYDAQLEVVRSLKAAGASPTRVKSAAMKLAQLKRATWVPSGTASRKKKRRAAIEAVKEGFDPSEVEKMEAARDAAAVAEYPPRDPPPMDADGFVVSFPPPRVRTAVNTEGAEGGADTAVHDDDDAAAMVFFRRYGFVVYRDVLSKDECASTRAEIWNHLERVQFPPTPGASRCLSRHDRTTWDLMDNVATYGLAPDPAVFTRQLVRNRQNPRVLACLAAVLRRETIYDSPTASTSEHSCVPSELTPACLREVIVSQDRWCVYRPTVNVPVGSGDGTTDKPEWRTRPNVHLDLHPWNFNARDGADVLPTEDLTFENLRDFSRETNAVSHVSGPHCQGVVALMDNRTEDGGTVLVPGFHDVFNDWQKALGDPARYAAAHEDWGRNRLVWRGAGAGSFKFGSDDAVHRLKVRAPIREGSFLIWDQRVAHGSEPNESDQPRMAQFIKGFRRGGAGEGRLARRAARVKAELERAGLLGEVSELGRVAFGLDYALDSS